MRELKHKFARWNILCDLSHPLGVRELKLHLSASACAFFSSHPLGVRELKLLGSGVSNINISSHPLGVRELKPSSYDLSYFWVYVAPFRGA